MLDTLIVINSCLLIALSILHIYWVFGGTWALEGAIPEIFKERFFDPKYKILYTIATLVVAVGLLLFATIVAGNYFYSPHHIPGKWISLLTKIIGAIFLVRAIGDFRYFGIFKKKSNDLFSEMDTRIYIPLCLFLGLSCLAIAYLPF